MNDRLVEAAYQAAEELFARKKEETLGGLPWLIGVVTEIATVLQERFPRARLGRLFWDENHFPGDDQPGCWVVDIFYPESQLGTIKAAALDDYCTSMIEKHGLAIEVVGRSHRRE